MDMERVILHCDLNNFYASVECLYRPELKNRPVAVCGDEEKRHGIVLAKNEIAKKFDIKTGEVIWQAKRKCPNLIVLKPNYELYLRFSKLAYEIYSEYTDIIEPFGIDECWLDITKSINLFGDGANLAYKIKERIKSQLGLTISVGVSFNKVFAKMGSDLKKPDAVTVISKDNYKKILWPRPIKELLYVGPSTERKLYMANIRTVGDLAKTNIDLLKKMFGKWGEILWIFANGLDNNPVVPTLFNETIKGIGNSVTTPRDLKDFEDVRVVIYVLSESVARRLREHSLKCRTVQVWIRDNFLMSIVRQDKVKTPTYLSSEIAEKAFEIFNKNWNFKNNIRSIGVRATDLVSEYTPFQTDFFEYKKREKKECLEKSIDNIRKRFGHYSIQRAVMLTDPKLILNPYKENIIHPFSYFKNG